MSNETYIVRIEDQIYRSARIEVEAASAAEAALIARQMAIDEEVEMEYQDHLRDPAIYEVEGIARLGDLPGTNTNTGCLCEHLPTLLENDGWDGDDIEEEVERLSDEYDSDD